MQELGRELTRRAELPTLPVADINRLAQTIDTSGVAVLRDVIPAAMLDQARDYIKCKLHQHDNQYFGLAGREWIVASPLAELARSSAFHDILAALWEHAMRRAAPDVEVTSSLRVLAGTVGLKHSGLFHYDSYVVTALVPLIIPDGADEPRGDLVLYPNLRRVRRHAIVNVLEKAVVENALSRAIWRLPLVQRWLSARAIPMQPGNIYFFWGMRSLHANRACLPESVRCTALFHFGDPHAASVLKRFSARHHQARLKRLNRAPRTRAPR
jgi:hypothetical protein